MAHMNSENNLRFDNDTKYRIDLAVYASHSAVKTPCVMSGVQNSPMWPKQSRFPIVIFRLSYIWFMVGMMSFFPELRNIIGPNMMINES